MATLTTSRTQRLRTLENEIRKGMEEFYYTGMKLREIRDDELYKEDGFSTWEEYCRKRWEWSRDYVLKLITAAEYREKLPEPPKSGGINTTGIDSKKQGWSERAVRELTRIPSKRDAVRVAEKIIKQVEKQAAVDPSAKLTATVVRKAVDRELGIDRTAKAAETKERNNAGIELATYLRDCLGRIEGITNNLAKVPGESWKLLDESEPGIAKRLATACDKLAALLRS